MSMAQKRKGWCSISSAVILSFGSRANIFFRRLIAWGSTLSQNEEFRLKLHFLLFSQTQSEDLPSKRGLLTRRMWKMRPREKMSQEVLSFCPFWQVMISGATQPGVPHRQKRQSLDSVSAARPKSAMTGESPFLPLSMMFSGLMSRCITLYLCIQQRPLVMPLIKDLTSSSVKRAILWLILLWSCPSPSSSRMMYMEFQLSKMASSFMMFGDSKVLSISISFSSTILLLGLDELMVEDLEKALAAKWVLSVSRSTSQTVAKPPFPNFLTGLYNL